MENNDPSEKAKEAEYARSGMMMLITIAILFVVIIVMLCLHVYLRWYLLRHRQRQQQPRRNSRSRSRNRNRPHFIFYVDPALTTASRGLDASVIASLPVFTFSPSSDDVECAVCLSEFEEGETGRVLPKCKHSFHLECIDMWFESHSTCPLCRVHVEVSVEPEVVVVNNSNNNNNVCETEPGSNSEEVNRVEEANSNSSSYHYSSASSSSSIWKCLSFKSVGEESASGYETATSSPMMSRMMSLKRILSREKKESSSVAELDVERGGGGGGDSVS